MWKSDHFRLHIHHWCSVKSLFNSKEFAKCLLSVNEIVAVHLRSGTIDVNVCLNSVRICLLRFIMLCVACG